ncbi:hypothetical protein B484DRAFT_409178 [Ochromonadaceae sp. CCMP2298]|nr:hypothetical protein B484DRAFT_409178 [Ochromonadaceae sp. CCMP2298]
MSAAGTKAQFDAAWDSILEMEDLSGFYELLSHEGLYPDYKGCESCAQELFRFLFIRSLHSSVAPSMEVERGWRVLLMLPHFYARVCALLIKEGQTTLQHEANIIAYNPMAAYKTIGHERSYEKLLDRYEEVFPLCDQPELWPELKREMAARKSAITANLQRMVEVGTSTTLAKRPRSQGQSMSSGKRPCPLSRAGEEDEAGGAEGSREHRLCSDTLEAGALRDSSSGGESGSGGNSGSSDSNGNVGSSASSGSSEAAALVRRTAIRASTSTRGRGRPIGNPSMPSREESFLLPAHWIFQCESEVEKDQILREGNWPYLSRHCGFGKMKGRGLNDYLMLRPDVHEALKKNLIKPSTIWASARLGVHAFNSGEEATKYVKGLLRKGMFELLN